MKVNVQSVALAGAAELLESYGQDPTAIARQAGLPVKGLYSLQQTLEGREIAAFFELAARVCHNRYFGIELAHQQGGLQLMGAVWLLMRSAPTVGDALECLADNFMLHTDITSISLKPETGGTSICYETLEENMDDEVQIIEHGLALVCIELRARLGLGWQPKFAQLRHSAPYNLTPLKHALGQELYFNQDQHAIFIEDADLRRTYTTNNKNTHSLIGNQVKQQVEGLDAQLLVKTEVLIRTLLSSHRCQLGDVADELGISSRSLQRQLMQQKLSFQQLVDKVKLDLAKKYLLHSQLSVGSVAERLQYSETAAFTRFFKRMTGLTPRKYIQKQRID